MVDASLIGRRRVAALLERLLDLPAGDEADTETARWALAFPRDGALGLDPEGLDRDRLTALAWAGVPLARGGALRFGRDVLPGDGDVPEAAGEAVRVPPAARLRACTSLALKPLRALVARACHVRVQTGPGVHLFLWPERAVLVSCAELPLGGFLHGPNPGQRESVALEPGECQVISW